jgi:hypothetical protein
VNNVAELASGEAGNPGGHREGRVSRVCVLPNHVRISNVDVSRGLVVSTRVEHGEALARGLGANIVAQVLVVRDLSGGNSTLVEEDTLDVVEGIPLVNVRLHGRGSASTPSSSDVTQNLNTGSLSLGDVGLVVVVHRGSGAIVGVDDN